jgi:uncharacterized protein (TIGR02246 family)
MVVVTALALTGFSTLITGVTRGDDVKPLYRDASDSVGELARVQVARARDHYCLALRTLPADSVATCYAPGGQLLLPGLSPLAGRTAIRDFLAPMAAAVAVDSTSMETEYAHAAPGFVSEWGTYRQVAGPRGGAHDLHVGRFSALWSYDEKDGRWLIERLMMQPLPTPTSPATPGPTPAPGK